MPALMLPATFSNSFWSADYRRGIETLYNKLERGVAENEDIIAFIRLRANTEEVIANTLLNARPADRGFNDDDGATLLMAFRGLEAESRSQGEAHCAVAKELRDLVATPFAEWAEGHRERIYGSRNSLIDGWLKTYELAQGDVDKLKHQYLAKVRKADEAEDDAKFAPNSELSPDNYTASPRLAPRDRTSNPPQRTSSVSERIAQRFKELQRKAVNGANKPSDSSEPTSSTVVFDGASVSSEPESTETVNEKPLPPTAADKGKGKAVEEDSESLKSPPPMDEPLPAPTIEVRGSSPMPPPPPPPILLAGLALPPSAVSDLLKKAASEMTLVPVKIPIIGEYKDCFSGEDLVVWLVDNVQGFGGSLDRAEDAARDLAEREGVLRRIGEFGNAFENNDSAFYQFRPKAFNLAEEYSKQEQHSDANSPIVSLAPMADNIVKRSNTFVNIVQKAINDRHSEPFHIRARAEANTADKTYRAAVRKLDRQRLGLEERLEETLKLLQKWETDRLRAVKTVLLQYQGTLANLPTGLTASFERSKTLLTSYQPESDLRALIERYRTGPFKPAAQVYESLTHEEADVYFGIDLRRWAEGGWSSLRSDEPKKDSVPEVLSALLGALNTKYGTLSDDSEKRKSWIYEVPLAAVHHLREALNSVPAGKEFEQDAIVKYDAPVIASTVKLWLLELDPPLGTWEGWEEIRRLYPQVGSKPEEVKTEQHIKDLQVALQRLPKIHLLVLDAFLGHLKNLIDTTTVDEENEVFITKLGLSMGRDILRPKVENELSIQDRHPTLLFVDLLKHFNEIIPPTIARKKRESDKKLPTRKRTAIIDMRMSRSRLSVVGTDIDTREILEEQMSMRNPSMRPTSPHPPTSAASKTSTSPASATAPSPVQAEEAKAPEPVVLAPTPKRAPAPPPTVDEDPNAPPPMPVFKEPPPETEDDLSPPPIPKFVEPPPETEDSPSPKAASPAPNTEDEEEPKNVVVAPPTPTTPRARSPPVRSGSPRSRSGSSASSPISPSERALAGSGGGSSGGSGASLSRSGSSEASRLRGPRGARVSGARPQSGNVASMVAGLNRNGATRNTSPSSRSANRSSYAGPGSGRV